MKNLFVLILAIAFVLPLSVNAAWYWILNPTNPEEGDFVQMSALEYAETEISKNLLVYVKDDFKRLLDKAEDYKQCDSEYDEFMYSLQRLSTTTLDTTFKEKDFKDCIREGEQQEALKECDLEYIDEEFSDGQKVIHNKQIASCREEIQKRSEVDIVKVQAQIQSEPSEPQQAISPVTQVVPVSIKEQQASEVEEVREEKIDSEEQKVEEASVMESNIENQQSDEVEKVAEQETAIETPKNFFQKIISFFSHLFNW